MTGLFDKLHDKYLTMTKTQRKIASYIMLVPSEAAYQTLDEISQGIGVSKPSIMTFTRMLGYEGYSDLQKHLRQELIENPLLRSDVKALNLTTPPDHFMARSFYNDLNNLGRTIKDLDPAVAQRASEVICKADTVMTVGLRESYALAHYFYTRLVCVRQKVQIVNMVDSGMYEQFLSLGPNDVCVFFLFSYYTKRAVDILRLLHNIGVKVILITDPPADQVESYADLILPCYVDGIYMRNSSVAPIAVANYLSNLVISQDYNANLSYFSSSMELLKLYGAY